MERRLTAKKLKDIVTVTVATFLIAAVAYLGLVGNSTQAKEPLWPEPTPPPVRVDSSSEKNLYAFTASWDNLGIVRLGRIDGKKIYLTGVEKELVKEGESNLYTAEFQITASPATWVIVYYWHNNNEAAGIAWPGPGQWPDRPDRFQYNGSILEVIHPEIGAETKPTAINQTLVPSATATATLPPTASPSPTPTATPSGCPPETKPDCGTQCTQEAQQFCQVNTWEQQQACTKNGQCSIVSCEPIPLCLDQWFCGVKCDVQCTPCTPTPKPSPQKTPTRTPTPTSTPPEVF